MKGKCQRRSLACTHELPEFGEHRDLCITGEFLEPNNPGGQSNFNSLFQIHVDDLAQHFLSNYESVAWQSRKEAEAFDLRQPNQNLRYCHDGLRKLCPPVSLAWDEDVRRFAAAESCPFQYPVDFLLAYG